MDAKGPCPVHAELEARRILAETEPEDSGAYGWSVNPYLLTLPARMALAEALENFVSW
jgi:hypothetical protein